jgi:hypothetical protein
MVHCAALLLGVLEPLVVEPLVVELELPAVAVGCELLEPALPPTPVDPPPPALKHAPVNRDTANAIPRVRMLVLMLNLSRVRARLSTRLN